jgi:hypothetical protein
MAVVTSAVAVVMVTVEERAMAMAVTLLAASGDGNGSNGTTMDVCDAILPQYADIINVGSDDDGECAPAIDGGKYCYRR